MISIKKIENQCVGIGGETKFFITDEKGNSVTVKILKTDFGNMAKATVSVSSANGEGKQVMHVQGLNK